MHTIFDRNPIWSKFNCECWLYFHLTWYCLPKHTDTNTRSKMFHSTCTRVLGLTIHYSEFFRIAMCVVLEVVIRNVNDAQANACHFILRLRKYALVQFRYVYNWTIKTAQTHTHTYTGTQCLRPNQELFDAKSTFGKHMHVSFTHSHSISHFIFSLVFR